MELGLRRRLAHAFYATPLYRMMLRGRHPHGLATTPTDPWPGDPEIADAMFRGLYRFHGEEITSPRQAPWNIEGVSEGWAAELHGFAWLRDFAAQGGDAARRQAQAMVDSWVRSFADWHPFAWRSDILGRRMISWASHGPLIILNTELTHRSRVLDSMARQARHLARAVDLAPAGTPHLTAIVGLIYSGLALPDGRRRLSQGLRLLGRELQRQVLGDGGHVSRNPSLHMAVLRDLTAVRAALADAGHEIPAELQNTIDRMAPMLRFFRHGDGGLALFNGGLEHGDGDVDLTLAFAGARGKPVASAPHSGFERIVRQRTTVLVDVGAPPTENGTAPSAGLLAFEMSVGKARLVVNCGTPEGPDPQWLAAMRGTAAHSTLAVDDTNQFDPDAPPAIAVEATREESAGKVLIDASHDAYGRTYGLVHRRRLYLGETGDDLRGEDSLTPAEAGKAVPFTIRFHLHPTVRAALQEAGGLLIKPPSGGGWRFIATGGELSLQDSVYLGDGRPRRSQQVVITGHCDGRTRTEVKWAIRRVTTSPPRDEPEPVLPGLDL